MGLKKKNLLVSNLGVEFPEAYAQIDNLNVDIDGKCIARFKIQTSRDAISEKTALDEVVLVLDVDKTLPLHKQAYEYAKKEAFEGWEDDIPEEENPELEDDIPEEESGGVKE